MKQAPQRRKLPSIDLRGSSKVKHRNRSEKPRPIAHKVEKVRNSSSRALVASLPLLTYSPPPSYSRYTTAAAQEHVGPVVSWLDDYEGMVQRQVVTLFSGLAGSGKTALVCRIIAELSQRGRHVVVWHSSEDSRAKWTRRIELMGGVPALVRFADKHEEVWRVLQADDAPTLLVIDPLQQFIGGGAKNDEASRLVMNELTKRATLRRMAIVGIIHWKQHYQNKLVGSEAVSQIARLIHKVEQGQGRNNWLLRRVKAQDAEVECVLRFHTYKTANDEPVLAKFDSRVWEKSADGRFAEVEEIERFIDETTHRSPVPVSFVRALKTHGWMKYDAHVKPWFKRSGWRSVRTGYQGSYYWAPPGFRFHDKRWERQQEGGTWVEVDELPSVVEPRQLRPVDLVEPRKPRLDDTDDEPTNDTKEQAVLTATPKEVAELVRRELRFQDPLDRSTRRRELFFSLPWAIKEVPTINIDTAQNILDTDHFGISSNIWLC
jgi:hypothetical protein